jgi:hypothetical protein
MKAYYNNYLDQALKRREQNRLRYKDLYYRAITTFNKTIKNSGVRRSQSLYDYILDCYAMTVKQKLPVFTLFIDFQWSRFILENKDMTLYTLSLFGIVDFNLEFNNDYFIGSLTLEEITEEFLSKREVLFEDVVTKNSDGALHIYGDLTPFSFF